MERSPAIHNPPTQSSYGIMTLNTSSSTLFGECEASLATSSRLENGIAKITLLPFQGLASSLSDEIMMRNNRDEPGIGRGSFGLKGSLLPWTNT